MNFKTLCEYYLNLESTSKRLVKIEIIQRLLENCQTEEIKPVVYLTTGSLGPDFDSLVLGIKAQTALSIISEATGVPLQKVKKEFSKVGDLGNIIFEYFQAGNKQGSLDDWFGSDETVEYSILDIWEFLVKLSEIKGKSAIKSKINFIIDYFQNLTDIEAKYLIRILVSNLRVNVNSPTFLEAASRLYDIPREKLDRAYFVTSDLGLILESIKKDGEKSLEAYQHPTPGWPVKCMAAEREKDAQSIMERLGGKVAVEVKYDGYRVQVHVVNGNAYLYSRNQESYTEQFPDLTNNAPNVFSGKDAIFEGEIVAYDFEEDKIKPFQLLTQRSRKYNIEEIAEEIPVKVFVFDLLYLDGQSFIDYPFPKRRKLLEDNLVETRHYSLAPIYYCTSAEELDELLLKFKAENAEGIMVKDLRENSIYQAGGRGFGWIKYKVDYLASLSDTFDLVIIGAYHGKGKRGGYYGTLLMAAWNEDEQKYQTFCKVGSGLNDEIMEELTNKINELIIPEPPDDLEWKEEPDVWVQPKIILEIEGAEISVSPAHTVTGPDGNNFSLRFPRFKRIRYDKEGYSGCTTVAEINRMYRQQNS